MKTNSLYPLFMCASHKYPRNTKEALKNGSHFSMPLLCTFMPRKTPDSSHADAR